MTIKFNRPSDHERRMTAMRDRAKWEIGDPRWAAILFHAYENPDADAEQLRRDRDDVIAPRDLS